MPSNARNLNLWILSSIWLQHKGVSILENFCALFQKSGVIAGVIAGLI